MSQNYTISGIDVAKWQGDVDWNEVYKAGFKFGIAKCTEGADYLDKKFIQNWSRMMELDGKFYRGAYHFARPDYRMGRKGGETEGRWFASNLKEVGGYGKGCLPPALDFEKYSESTGKENIPWIEGFLDVVESELGRSCMIYTGANIWRYEVGNTDLFSEYPLWQVNYTNNGSPTRAMPWPWTFWQWSGGGDFAYYGKTVPGVPSKYVDINWYRYDEKRLAELALMTNGDDESSNDIGPPSSTEDFKEALCHIFCVNEDMEDLRGMRSELVAKVQGLLLAHEYGPYGLVDEHGHPDGIAGENTIKYFMSFKESFMGTQDTIIDSESLVYLMTV